MLAMAFLKILRLDHPVQLCKLINARLANAEFGVNIQINSRILLQRFVVAQKIATL
jgi:hypothetical protein